jgi:hypothetical protein
VRVKFIIRHGLVTGRKSRYDGIVFLAEFSDDVVDELIVGRRRIDCCHDITEGLHLLHVPGSRHPLLAKGLKLAINMTNIGAASRIVPPMHGGPYIHRRRAANKLASDD